MTSDMKDLDDLLASARGAERPGDNLVARVLADARQVQAEATTVSPAAAPRGAPGGFDLGVLLPALGGWPGLSGLFAATVTGLMIGVYAPDAVDTALGGQLSGLGVLGQTELLPGLDDLLALEEG